MFRRLLARSLLGFALATLFAAGSAAPSLAYGPGATWQITLAGTGVAPGTGNGFGFWGWCALGGGVTSGNSVDCQFAQYVHSPAGTGFTCHLSIDGTAWTGAGGTFVISTATASVTPVSLTGPCLAFFPGPAGFPVDLGIKAAPGHYNNGGLGPGLVGEFQVQVTQVG